MNTTEDSAARIDSSQRISMMDGKAQQYRNDAAARLLQHLVIIIIIDSVAVCCILLLNAAQRIT
jgi:hypothetical protein